MEIEGYPDYLIYEDGRIWTKKQNKFMKHSINDCGYFRVCLFNEKGQKFFKIHRLLAQHFIPNPDNKEFVDHIDRNRTNNSLQNLRWVTRTENNINKGLNKNNKFGEKFISFLKSQNRFVFHINREELRIQKRFEFLEDAIIYRDIFCYENDIDID